MAAYRHAEELAALLSPRVATQLAELRTPSGGYSDWLRLLDARRVA